MCVDKEFHNLLINGQIFSYPSCRWTKKEREKFCILKDKGRANQKLENVEHKLCVRGCRLLHLDCPGLDKSGIDTSTICLIHESTMRAQVT
jgi:hypothetical protein